MTMFPDRAPIGRRSVVLAALYVLAMLTILAVAFRSVSSSPRRTSPAPSPAEQEEGLARDAADPR